MYRTGVKTLAYQCIKYKCKKIYKQLLIPTCEHHEQNAFDLGLNEEGSWYDHQCPNPLVQCEGGIPLQSDQVHHIHSTSSLQHHECGFHPLPLSCEKVPLAIHTCLLWKGWQGRMHISLTCNISKPWLHNWTCKPASSSIISCKPGRLILSNWKAKTYHLCHGSCSILEHQKSCLGFAGLQKHEKKNPRTFFKKLCQKPHSLDVPFNARMASSASLWSSNSINANRSGLRATHMLCQNIWEKFQQEGKRKNPPFQH